jgi:hypothetical protein
MRLSLFVQAYPASEDDFRIPVEGGTFHHFKVLGKTTFSSLITDILYDSWINVIHCKGASALQEVPK